MKNFLFVCSQNRLRSPTAEQVFSIRDDIGVSSAGTNNDAENPLGIEQIEWADVIVVMEKHHRNKIQKRFYSALKSKRIVVLEIPDEYEFMDEGLVRLLKAKMLRYLPA
ncbi:MAG: phosphotyrosine protein phosphatase [Novosphingobium sp.]|uniref:low molecular weight protein tyrosine phosphatase family protein n=1 Tax=Novosphingobium sp. TaxID=1874826 RepID=UPI003C7D9EA3